MPKTYPLRLKPGADLKAEIEAYAKANNLKAAWVAACVGSLTRYHLRFANQGAGSVGEGHFEIVSLSGTVSATGLHLHMAVSDSTGHTTGGHLLEGNRVYTTAEIVLQEDEGFEFVREKDGSTPWEELQIRRRGQ